jgi:hypothetical protein
MNATFIEPLMKIGAIYYSVLGNALNEMKSKGQVSAEDPCSIAALNLSESLVYWTNIQMLWIEKLDDNKVYEGLNFSYMDNKPFFQLMSNILRLTSTQTDSLI